MTTIFEELRDKLKKLEALYTGGATEGERAAAGAAKERLIKKLEEAKATDEIIEMNFYLRDVWQRKLFTALCRRYNLRPFRHYRQKYTTVVVKAPKAFINDILWPEFQEINKILSKYLEESTDAIIKQEVHESTEEAEVISDSLQLEDLSKKVSEQELKNTLNGKLDRTIQQIHASKISRNNPCPCGSGKKYKKCCINKAGIKQFTSAG